MYKKTEQEALAADSWDVIKDLLAQAKKVAEYTHNLQERALADYISSWLPMLRRWLVLNVPREFDLYARKYFQKYIPECSLNGLKYITRHFQNWLNSYGGSFASYTPPRKPKLAYRARNPWRAFE